MLAARAREACSCAVEACRYGIEAAAMTREACSYGIQASARAREACSQGEGCSQIGLGKYAARAK